jgi:GPH family glycoside/pentoside/hexuronide:cation symporter
VAFFIGSGLFYYTALAIYTIPYFSLANEMTPDTHERTNILAFRQVPANLVTIALGYLPMFLAWKVFSDQLEAIRWAAVATSVAFITFGMLPLLFVKEPFYERASHQENISLKESFVVTVKSKLFVNLVGMKLLMTLGMQTVGTLGYYISVYYVVRGDHAMAGEIAGHGGLLAMALATASVPLVAMLTKRLGKIQALFANGGLFLVATLLQWFMITPEHPYWQLVTAGILGPAVTAIWIVLPSMQADVIDADELETGRRREGAFSAILAWVEKLGFATSVFLGGLILDVSGFDVRLSQQSDETLFRMRLLFVVFPIVMAAGMLWLLKSYPLTEKRVLEIRAELERRRGVVHTN